MFLCIALWTPTVTDAYGYTKYDVEKNPMVIYFPLFVIGVLFSDVENLKGWRPLDKLRNLVFPLAMLKNITLLFLFGSFGSFNGKDNCEAQGDVNCEYFRIVTLDYIIPVRAGHYIAAVSIILLALTSTWT